jgi:hypothetical protein
MVMLVPGACTAGAGSQPGLNLAASGTTGSELAGAVVAGEAPGTFELLQAAITAPATIVANTRATARTTFVRAMTGIVPDVGMPVA